METSFMFGWLHRQRLGSLIGTSLLVIGLFLFMGAGAFYGLGAYSYSRLGDLNADLHGSSSLQIQSSSEFKTWPNGNEPYPTISPNGNYSSIRSGFDGNIDHNLSQGSSPQLNPFASPVQLLDEKSSPHLKTNTDAAVLIQGYADIYPGSEIHPKHWGGSLRATGSNYSSEDYSIATDYRPFDESSYTPHGIGEKAIHLRIPSIAVDSSVKDLNIIRDGHNSKYETPNNTIGRVPTPSSILPGLSGWYFGHLESPIRGEGNVFHRLPEIPEYLRNGDPIHIYLRTNAGEYVYQAVSSRVAHEKDIDLQNYGTGTIVLVTCANRPFYNYRQLVIAKLVGTKP